MMWNALLRQVHRWISIAFMTSSAPVPAPSGRRRADLDATTAELQRRINSLLDQGLLRP